MESKSLGEYLLSPLIFGDKRFITRKKSQKWRLVDSEALDCLLNGRRKSLFGDFFEKTIKKKSNSLFVVYHVTNACNYRCKYCYADSGVGNSLSLHNALTFIDNLSSGKWNFNKIIVEFHGGEPLIEFQKIKKIVSYSKKKKVKISFCMQTNASLIDDEVCSFIKDNHIGVGVSVDGPGVIHDKQRLTSSYKGSFDKTIAGIKKLRQYGIKFSMISVATKNTLKFKEEYFKFLIENGIESFNLNPMHSIGRGEANKELALTNDELINLYKFIIDKVSDYNINSGSKMSFGNIDTYFSMLKDTGSYHRCNNCPGCGSGINMLGLGPDGCIYPCEELVFDSEFNLGNPSSSQEEVLDSKFNKDFQKVKDIENIKKCSECAFKFLCGGGCSSKRYHYGGSFKSLYHFCKFNKWLIGYLLRGMYEKGWRDGCLVSKNG